MKKYKYKKIFSLFLIVLCFALYSSKVSAIEAPHHCCCETEHHHQQPVIKDGAILSITDCIAVGISNSPIIKEYEHKYELAKSNVGTAKSEYFPTLGLSANIGQIYNSDHEDFYHNYKEYPNFNVMLNKMIWDFGKTTANIRMEEFLKIAAQYEFEDSVCSTVFDIKDKYYATLRAKAIFAAAQQNYKIEAQTTKEMENLVLSKKKNKVDFLNSQIQQSQAKIQMLDAEDDYANAKENLNNAMFLDNAPNYEIYETQTFQYFTEKSPYINISNKKNATIKKDETIFEHPHFTYSEATSLAYKNSPDLKVLVAVKNAMEQSLLFVKRSYYPEIGGRIGYDILNTNQYYNNDLAIGVNVSSSLNLMKQKYDIKSANQELNIAQDTINKFKKDLYYRVRRALNTVNETQSLIPIAKEQNKIAENNLTLTKNNYTLGSMNQLDVQDAIKSYHQSLLNVINSQYRYNIALINLEMSMHYHLIDYHEKSEHAIEYHEDNPSDTLSKMITCKKKHKQESKL
ncbi:MAG: TolC family protein [Candidatus Gastranaerophilales bacterium]|nr:TolC family protein [Candidatus Gastranaerophilales bacterium]